MDKRSVVSTRDGGRRADDNTLVPAVLTMLLPSTAKCYVNGHLLLMPN